MYTNKIKTCKQRLPTDHISLILPSHILYDKLQVPNPKPTSQVSKSWNRIWLVLRLKVMHVSTKFFEMNLETSKLHPLITTVYHRTAERCRGNGHGASPEAEELHEFHGARHCLLCARPVAAWTAAWRGRERIKSWRGRYGLCGLARA